jgi:hypothetical protein
MRLRAQVWGMMALVIVMAGCTAGLRTIYQDDFLTVSLESNPAGDGQVREEKGAQAITAQQLSDTLRGLYARKKKSFLESLVGAQSELVFREDELPHVAGEIQKGLRQALPQERVAFRLWRPQGRGREETSGAVYLRGRLLYVTLTKFRVPDLVRYNAEYGSGTDFELFYEPSEALVPRQQGFAAEWLGADSTAVIIDIRKVAGSSMPAAAGAPSERRPESSSTVQPMPPPPVAAPPKSETTTAQQKSPASPAVTVEVLQQQVKDLAESNQMLREKLKQAQEGREPSQSVTEELVRLRQELTETKQLLGEKVLELNRLKKKTE